MKLKIAISIARSLHNVKMTQEKKVIQFQQKFFIIKQENKDPEDAKIAKVELKFPINIAFWQLKQEYKLEGYAR